MKNREEKRDAAKKVMATMSTDVNEIENSPREAWTKEYIEGLLPGISIEDLDKLELNAPDKAFFRQVVTAYDGGKQTIPESLMIDIMKGDGEAIAQAIQKYGLAATKEAILTAKSEAWEAQQAQQALEQAKNELLALVQPEQATKPVTELSQRVKTLFGDKPTQSEFLSSVLMSIGYDHAKAKTVHASILTKAVAEAIGKAYGDKLPETVTGHKTTWLDDSTTRQRISNHISKPPKFYLEGHC
jgi:hypothetical protein